MKNHRSSALLKTDERSDQVAKLRFSVAFSRVRRLENNN